MKAIEVVHAWGRILQGRFPTLSIEITRECPLHCPGCYAYEDGHLGGGANLRHLSDFKGETLIEGVLAPVRRYRPLRLSIVGGDPLVRFREMEVLLPRLNRLRVFVQLHQCFSNHPALLGASAAVEPVQSPERFGP